MEGLKQLIAVTGKGGSGKTTISSLLARFAIDAGIKPVLAVDADPNSTLAPLLGVEVKRTFSDIREEIMAMKSESTGVPKERVMERELNECIVEADGFDVVSMGRPEGKDCYCYVNNLLRGGLENLRGNYRLTVVDNEAGMEHLSRMNTDDIDCLLVVSEPTMVGARSARRILELADSLKLRVGRRVLAWNKVGSGGVPAGAKGIFSGVKLDDEFCLPQDEGLARLSVNEESVFNADLPAAAVGLLDVCLAGGREILKR